MITIKTMNYSRENILTLRTILEEGVFNHLSCDNTKRCQYCEDKYLCQDIQKAIEFLSLRAEQKG